MYAMSVSPNSTSRCVIDAKRQEPLRPPPLGYNMEAPEIDVGLVVRALAIKEAQDIDLKEWERAIDFREHLAAVLGETG